METLDKKYIETLENIKSTIQNSEILSRYLEDEEEEIYKELRAAYEPHIENLHNEVALKNPLQLVTLEDKLRDEGFEGLYLPRILGYVVLRGEINDRIKYIRPQDHFKDILMSICNSNNFEILKLRVGQAVQIGFALSSDIWITSLVNSISNKRVKSFLMAQKLERYRDQSIRLTGLVKFRKQFETLNYQTAEFPTTIHELKHVAPSLKSFIVYRSSKEFDNTSINPAIKDFVENMDFIGSNEYCEIIILAAKSLELDAATLKSITKSLDQIRESDTVFEDDFFDILNNFHKNRIPDSPASAERLARVVTRKVKDEVTEYFNLMDIINANGYADEDAVDATRAYYDSHEGLSVQNECLRNTILGYFSIFMKNIETRAYHEYFEMNKTFVAYMSIFSNQQFNQSVKDISFAYIKKLKKVYLDKRGKDYQDIKKFVKTTFLDLGFLKEKQIVEFFKTKRKKKVD